MAEYGGKLRGVTGQRVVGCGDPADRLVLVVHFPQHELFPSMGDHQLQGAALPRQQQESRPVVRAQHKVGLPVTVDVCERARRIARREVGIF